MRISTDHKAGHFNLQSTPSYFRMTPRFSWRHPKRDSSYEIMFLLSPASGPCAEGRCSVRPPPPCSKAAFPASWVKRSYTRHGILQRPSVVTLHLSLRRLGARATSVLSAGPIFRTTESPAAEGMGGNECRGNNEYSGRMDSLLQSLLLTTRSMAPSSARVSCDPIL